MPGLMASPHLRDARSEGRTLSGVASGSSQQIMTSPVTGRPWGLTLAVVSTALFAVFFLIMTVLSLTGGNGIFSGHIALGLAAWAAVNAGAAIALARRAWWSRGPVVALGLLHVLAFGQSALVTPWALMGAVVGVVAVVGAVGPTTRAALRGSVNASADE